MTPLKTYEFIGFKVMDVTKPYACIGFRGHGCHQTLSIYTVLGGGLLCMRGGNTPGAKRIAGIHSGHSGKRSGTNPSLWDEMGIFPISLPRGAITVFCGVAACFN